MHQSIAHLKDQPTLSADPPAPTFARGFSLVEMAVVLVIVALLLGGLLLPMTAQDDMRRTAETRATLANVQEALLGFAVVNGRLPRPATAATDGAENPANCASDAACSGFIPWATLGIEKQDAWGKLIRYSVTPAYANSSITLASIANRTVRTRDNAGTAVYLAGQATCTTPGACVAAVVFSHGKLRWGTTESGTALPDGSTTNADEDANHTGPTNYFQRTPATATTGGGEFDDMVIWLPTNILINRMIAAGRLL
ncbi:MAG: prepilin-type N-terminal cleavage/methylation domain-containing protein [Rhodocyclaceae bacterium]|nr:prepilin-type N-terminal cleavage/methylation domain-containing protein [Rhodocyclaceae bacterium]